MLCVPVVGAQTLINNNQKNTKEMNKTLISVLLMAAATASAAPLTLEKNGNSMQSYDLEDIGRIDLTDNTNVKVVGTHGTVLISGLSTASLKLNFTDDVPTAVDKASVAEKEITTVRKRIVNGCIVIEAADGTVINVAGQRIK